MKIQYDFIFIFERLGRMRKNKTFNFFFVLTKTRYFNIKFVSLQYKIQTNIVQNWLKKYMEKSQIFSKFFDLIFLIFFGAGSNSTHVAGLDPANPARSLVQTNDLAGEPKALVNMNNAKVI